MEKKWWSEVSYTQIDRYSGENLRRRKIQTVDTHTTYSQKKLF